MKVPPTGQIRRTPVDPSVRPKAKSKSVYYYHGTTVENARHILKDGMAGSQFYVTRRQSLARGFSGTKTLEQWWSRLFNAKDYSACVLALRQKDGERLKRCKPRHHNCRVGLNHIDWNQAELAAADISSNGVFDFLTPNGFSKFEVSIVDPKDRAKIEAANDKEDRQKAIRALRRIL